jgi:hypothetical protein
MKGKGRKEEKRMRETFDGNVITDCTSPDINAFETYSSVTIEAGLETMTWGLGS